MKTLLTKYRRLEINHTQCRCGRVARELEFEWECAGSQHWRQQGQPVEREAEWRMGVCQDIGGVGGCGSRRDVTVSRSLHEKLE